MKQRTTFKKTKVEYLLEEDYDEDLEELRQTREREAMEAAQLQKSREAAERWARYFGATGDCYEHDISGCRQCRHYAKGGCPSYWEERY